MLTKTRQTLLDKIGKESVLVDWEKAFGGKSFGNRHLERVNKIARFLSTNEGGDEFCTLAGAWIHDVSLAFGSDYNPVFVEGHTRTFLDKFKGLKSEEKDLIVRCAAGHEQGQKDLPIEAMIVHDADVLDKSGMLGVIRHMWKMTNMLENRVLTGNNYLKKLLTHLEEREDKLFTKTAIKLAKKVNRFRELFAKDKKFALDVLPKISQMAMDGKTSDIIANWLVNNYDHPSLDGLKLQLSSSHLSSEQMKKSKTKIDLFEDLESRGLIYQMTPGLEKASRDGLTLYWGIDPTGDSMHVGHFLGVMMARRFLAAGHKVIVLVGGGTSMIGDPSGKNEERPILSKEVIEGNKKKLKKLIEKLLGVKEGTVTMVDNADWLEKISLIDFLREVGKYIPVSTMLGKEMVKTRMESETGISYAEFSYQLLQAYDYFVLSERIGCNLQIGGSDQWGNIVTGVDLIRKKTGKQVFGMSFPLVVDPKTGRKFGKSEKGASIWLEAYKTHPFLLFQFFMNTSDDLIPLLVNFYSFRPKMEIDRLVVEWKKNKEGRLLQRELATEILNIVHGEKSVRECLRVASILFDKTSVKMTREDLDFIQGALPSIEIPKGQKFVPEKHLVDLGLASSRSEAMRLVKQKGVSIEEMFDKFLLIRKGKKEYGLIKLI